VAEGVGGYSIEPTFTPRVCFRPLLLLVQHLGTLAGVRFIDGALYSGSNFTTLMLRVSETSRSWYCYWDLREYQSMHFQTGKTT
jgi:hypothetical protein